MDDFASIDTPGGSGGVKVVEWNQNQLIRSLCNEDLPKRVSISGALTYFGIIAGYTLEQLFHYTQFLHFGPELE